jgi:hypothetical protein
MSLREYALAASLGISSLGILLLPSYAEAQQKQRTYPIQPAMHQRSQSLGIYVSNGRVVVETGTKKTNVTSYARGRLNEWTQSRRESANETRNQPKVIEFKRKPYPRVVFNPPRKQTRR